MVAGEGAVKAAELAGLQAATSHLAAKEVVASRRVVDNAACTGSLVATDAAEVAKEPPASATVAAAVDWTAAAAAAASSGISLWPARLTWAAGGGL